MQDVHDVTSDGWQHEEGGFEGERMSVVIAVVAVMDVVMAKSACVDSAPIMPCHWSLDQTDGGRERRRWATTKSRGGAWRNQYECELTRIAAGLRGKIETARASTESRANCFCRRGSSVTTRDALSLHAPHMHVPSMTTGRGARITNRPSTAVTGLPSWSLHIYLCLVWVVLEATRPVVFFSLFSLSGSHALTLSLFGFPTPALPPPRAPPPFAAVALAIRVYATSARGRRIRRSPPLFWQPSSATAPTLASASPPKPIASRRLPFCSTLRPVASQ